MHKSKLLPSTYEHIHDHFGWVDQGSVEYEVCLTLLYMTSTENWTLDRLILSPPPYLFGDVLRDMVTQEVWGLNY